MLSRGSVRLPSWSTRKRHGCRKRQRAAVVVVATTSKKLVSLLFGAFVVAKNGLTAYSSHQIGCMLKKASRSSDSILPLSVSKRAWYQISPVAFPPLPPPHLPHPARKEVFSYFPGLPGNSDRWDHQELEEEEILQNQSPSLKKVMLFNDFKISVLTCNQYLSDSY